MVVGALGLLIRCAGDRGTHPSPRRRAPGFSSAPRTTIQWADDGYAGKLVAWATRHFASHWRVRANPRAETPLRCCHAAGWSNAQALCKMAMIGLMVCRLEPPPGRRPWQTNSRRINSALRERVLRCPQRSRAFRAQLFDW